MGWMLVQNVAIASVLAGVAALASRLRRVGPVARHALWLVVLIKLVTPPFLVLQSPWAWPETPAATTESPLDARPVTLIVLPVAGGTQSRPAAVPLPEIRQLTSDTTIAVSTRRAAASPPLFAW